MLFGFFFIRHFIWIYIQEFLFGHQLSIIAGTDIVVNYMYIRKLDMIKIYFGRIRIYYSKWSL